MFWPKDLKAWLEVAAYVVAIGSAIFSTCRYYWNSRQERTKWLFELYDRFYNRPELKEMRARIERSDTAFAQKEDDPEGLEKLDDYLNFFEFLAYLHKRNQLKQQELTAMFDYPLRRLADDGAIQAYIQHPEYGYEQTRELLRKLGYSR